MNRCLLNEKKGSALILSFMIIALLSIYGSAMISSTLAESRMVARQLDSAQAFWLAEAGAQKALWALNSGDWTGWTEIDSDTQQYVGLCNSGNYTVTVADLTADNPVITSAAGVGDQTRSVEITVENLAGSLFSYAAFGLDSLIMSGNGQTDSYDSSAGAYGGDNVGSDGDIGTNAGTDGAISLSGNATVNGDAGTGTGGTVSTSGNAEVNGDVSDDLDEDYPSVSVPSELESLVSLGSLSVGGNSSSTITSGDYEYSSISVTGNGILTVTGDVRIYLSAETSLGISGNGQLVVSSDASLTFYTDGTCSISGNGVANQTTLPSNFLIYSTYSGSNGISISGNGNLIGAIYAPDTDASNTGNGDLYGALVAKSVNISGNGDIHFDEALTSLESGAQGYVVQDWREPDDFYPLEN